MKTVKMMMVAAMAVQVAMAAGDEVDKDNNYGVFDYQPAAEVTNFVNQPPANALYRNPQAPIEQRIEDVLKYMTIEEKMSLLHMTGGASAGDLPRLGLANFRVYDGPNGARCDRPITYFPTCISYAAAWDRELTFAVAQAMGRENRASWAETKAVGRMLLAPGADIARSPTGARNFEYFGEDPLLAGEMAAAYCRGLQSVKVSPCLKHYVLNDQEWCRTVIDVTCPKRALREIYQRPFEIAIRKADPWAIMNSYNLVFGQYASHSLTVNGYLRKLGWTGALVPDWGGYHGAEGAFNGGTTFESGCRRKVSKIRNEVKLLNSGKLDRELIEKAWRDSLRHYFRVGAFDAESKGEQALQAECVRLNRGEEHRRIAYRAAAESLVMLKNEGGILPLRRDGVKTVCIIGPNADFIHTMINGKPLKECGGSGAIIAGREPTPLAVAREIFGAANVFTNAADAAKADLVVYFGGYNHLIDREVLGWGHIKEADRKDITLDDAQVREIREVAKLNPKLVVSLTTGAPVSVDPWEADVPALFVQWYAGEEGPAAFYDALFGKVNPSGRLPYTFGRQLKDWYCHRLGEKVFPGVLLHGGKTVNGVAAVESYDDGIWVGYRGFDKFGVAPKYPFGFGLSYTTFAIANGEVKVEGEGERWKVFASVQVKNTGKLAGRCVVQCYVTKPGSAKVEMPEKELADFASVELQPGESREVTFELGFEQLKYFDEAKDAWSLAKGEYVISAGADSANRPAAFKVEL